MKKTVFNRFAKVTVPCLAPFVRNGWLYMFDQKSGAVYAEKIDHPDGYYKMPMDNTFVKISDIDENTPDWSDRFVCSNPVEVSKKDMQTIKFVSSQASDDEY